MPGLLQNLLDHSRQDIADDFRLSGAARATRGYRYPVCNLDMDLWIWGYRYGYVSMTRYTDPGGTVSMTPYVDVWGYIPAGLRPSLHTGHHFVKQNRQNTPPE